MGFSKLDENFIESSLKRHGCLAVDVFTSLLSKAGADGIARVSIPFLATNTWHENGEQCKVEEIDAVIKILESPDPYSRSINNEGRRIRRVDGGYEIINYLKYRGKTHLDYFREYYHQHKDREQKEHEAAPVIPAEPKKEKAKFIPPTIEEVKEYFRQNGYSDEGATRFFKGYSEANPPWTDREGKQIRSWKTKAQQVWFKPENKLPPPKTLDEFEKRKYGKVTSPPPPAPTPTAAPSPMVMPEPDNTRNGKGMEHISDILEEVTDGLSG